MPNEQRDYERMATSWLNENRGRVDPAQREQIEAELARRRQEEKDG